MNKLLIYISLLAISLITIASASTYSPNEDIIIRAFLHSQDEAVDGLANISVWFPNGTIDITNASMSDGDALGDFTYDYTFADLVVGDYFVRVDFYNSTDSSYYGSAEDVYRVLVSLNITPTNNLLQQILDHLSGTYVEATTPNGTTQLTLHYPETVCVNQSFTVSSTYIYNDNLITDGIVEVDGVTMPYSSMYKSNRKAFTVGAPNLVNFTVTANSTDPNISNLTINGTINVTECVGLNIYLWQEREYDTQRGADWAIQKRNFDKQLDTPYLNDFGYIIARNLDLNGTGLYTYCRLPIGGVNNYINTLENLLGSNLSRTMVDLVDGEEYVGCNDYWYRATYSNGQATLTLPDDGNYSLYFIDGVLQWENEYAPPQVVKSSLFVPLGQIELKDGATLYETDFYITHGELAGWTAITEDYFLIFVILIPILIIGASIYMRIPIRFALIAAIGWALLWIFIRMNS